MGSVSEWAFVACFSLNVWLFTWSFIMSPWVSSSESISVLITLCRQVCGLKPCLSILWFPLSVEKQASFKD